MARPRKPTRVLQLQGTYEKSRHDARHEPQAPLTALPPPPGILGEVGCYEWGRVGPRLVEYGILTDGDLAVFTSYCLAVEEIAELTKIINRDGRMIVNRFGDPVTHPACNQRTKAQNTARLLGTELGLSPSSRSRVATVAPPEKVANPWDALA